MSCGFIHNKLTRIFTIPSNSFGCTPDRKCRCHSNKKDQARLSGKPYCEVDGRQEHEACPGSWCCRQPADSQQRACQILYPLHADGFFLNIARFITRYSRPEKKENTATATIHQQKIYNSKIVRTQSPKPPSRSRRNPKRRAT